MVSPILTQGYGRNVGALNTILTRGYGVYDVPRKRPRGSSTGWPTYEPYNMPLLGIDDDFLVSYLEDFDIARSISMVSEEYKSIITTKRSSVDSIIKEIKDGSIVFDLLPVGKIVKYEGLVDRFGSEILSLENTLAEYDSLGNYKQFVDEDVDGVIKSIRDLKTELTLAKNELARIRHDWVSGTWVSSMDNDEVRTVSLVFLSVSMAVVVSIMLCIIVVYMLETYMDEYNSVEDN